MPQQARRRKLAFRTAALALFLLWRCAALGAANPLPGSKLETAFFRFTLCPTNGACEILDKQARMTWRSNTNHIRFGEALLYVHGQPRQTDLTHCELESTGDALLACFRPLPELPQHRLRLWIRALADQKTLEFSYQEDIEIDVEKLSVLGDVMVATASGKGYVVVPVREGLLVPADSGLSFTHRFDTSDYEGCHMQMLGVVQDGAAALFTWQNPYVAAELKSVADNSAVAALKQTLTPSIVLRKSARSFRIHFLGKGDYVTLAKAYRDIAKAEGLVMTWGEKLKGNPARSNLFGAANFKLWSALDRHMDLASTKEESVRTNWTFAEAAQVAAHLKRDLKMDKVLFILGGWIHRGYDNQHPDILPAAPECGGDAALSDCARQVRELGYLFCLHDNYQDIYRDSPSWDERLIMKTDEGKLVRGGHWAGGQAYMTCSEMALELAQRPQNLPAVKKLTGADAYFIDTTYAAPLQECFDPRHPLTRRDDIQWKQALSDYARGVFGVFGSECGREWAIPHSDFFEGLTGVSGHYYHDAGLPGRLGATVVPLFEIIYRDCVAAYGKYGYDPNQAAEYVLHHISIARPLNYHSVPPHLYWQQSGSSAQAETVSPAGAPDSAIFARADTGWTAGLHPFDRFVKNTYEVLSPLNELTARTRMTQHRFLTPDRKVQQSTFGEGVDAVVVTVNAGSAPFACSSRLSGKVELPRYGFLVESRTFAAFNALSFGGLRYDAPTMFTLRSLDNRPLSRSRQVRVFHAFGDDHLRLGKTSLAVHEESIIGPSELHP